MNLIHRSQIQMLATLQVFGILALASFAFDRAEEPSVEALKARIEGVYVLQEWHRHGEIFRPPLVDARTVLLNGHIMFISHDWAQEPNKTTVAGYGIYILEPGKSRIAMNGLAWLHKQQPEHPCQKTCLGRGCAPLRQASRTTRSAFAPRTDHGSFGSPLAACHTRTGIK